MASQTEITNMAVFCDFENVALGVRDANYAKFDIDKVLERLTAFKDKGRVLQTSLSNEQEEKLRAFVGGSDKAPSA